MRGGHTFETRVVQTGPPAPDPGWSCLDVNGHRHAWVLERGQPPSLPTCRAMQFVESFQGTEVRTLRYECASCGVPIEPGRIVETIHQFLLDGREVTETDFFRCLDWVSTPPTLGDQSSRAGASTPIVYSCPQCQEPLCSLTMTIRRARCRSSRQRFPTCIAARSTGCGPARRARCSPLSILERSSQLGDG